MREIESGVQSGVVQADGREAMVVSADGVVHVVDLEQRTDTGARFPDPGFTAPSESRLALSADGTLLAQIGRNGRDIDTGDNWLVLYDVGTRTFRVPPVHLAAAVGDLAVALTVNGWCWPAVRGGEIFIHRADTGSFVRTIPGLPEPEADLLNTAAVAFDPDGNLFVSSKAGTVRIFDPADPRADRRAPAISAARRGQLAAGLHERWSDPRRGGSRRSALRRHGTYKHGCCAGQAAPGQCLSISIGPGPNGQLYCGDPFGRIAPFDVTSGQSSGQQLDTQLANEVRVIVTPDGLVSSTRATTDRCSESGGSTAVGRSRASSLPIQNQRPTASTVASCLSSCPTTGLSCGTPRPARWSTRWNTYRPRCSSLVPIVSASV